jgi:hypothetical protein
MNISWPEKKLAYNKIFNLFLCLGKGGSMTTISLATWLVQFANIASGISAIVFPFFFVFAFGTHPDLSKPRLVKNGDDIIRRVRKNKLMHIGHVLMIFSVPLLMLTAVKLTLLTQTGGYSGLGFAGGIIAILGAISLAVDKGALCLVVSAFDTLPDKEFAQLKPAFRTISQKASWLKLVWGIVLLPSGFLILAIANLVGLTIPTWQCICLMIGSVLLLVPDGFEIINLSASIILIAGLLPMGLTWLI